MMSNPRAEYYIREMRGGKALSVNVLQTHTRAHAHLATTTHTPIHTHSPPATPPPHTHAQGHADTHDRKQTRAHTHTHAHAHARARAHTHLVVHLDHALVFRTRLASRTRDVDNHYHLPSPLTHRADVTVGISSLEFGEARLVCHFRLRKRVSHAHWDLQNRWNGLSASQQTNQKTRGGPQMRRQTRPASARSPCQPRFPARCSPCLTHSPSSSSSSSAGVDHFTVYKGHVKRFDWLY